MQEQGLAAWYSTISDINGKWETFQMQIDNCRVVWRTSAKSNTLTPRTPHSQAQAQTLTTLEAQ
ncbi:hypothetical protein CYG68_03600 [Morganella morganii]|uniref:Uncharacterized protein n=2 Tax=Morganella morganii TaxID=582 RepID=A0A8I0U504_MORMO|nr:hypothetical protein [Morganella morganii]